MTNSRRYKEEINGKVYENTLNVLGTYVRPYASFAPELNNKEVHVADNKPASVGDLGQEAVSEVSVEKSMEKE